ncbi:MAG: hypothetical protein ABSD45_06270 [Terriglobia bacterium]|jgi:hypothetical protein
MLSKHLVVRLSLCLVLLGLVAAVPVFAGSAVVGSVAGSMNATVGGQTLLPNTTLFSGDSLQVKDGVAVVALGSASRIVFGRNTVASFLRDSNEVTVLLGQGNVSVFHDVDGMPVRMKIGDVSVVPVSGFKTLGEVAMLNGAIVVTAKEGMLRVEGNGPAINVAKGKTITVMPEANAPQGGGKAPGGAGRCCGGSNVWAIAATAVAGGALIFAAVAESRAGTAENNSAAAESAAAAAAAAGSNAAAAAAAAASAAEAAASAAAAEANSLGCALNTLAREEGKASPYTPPAGESCS